VNVNFSTPWVQYEPVKKSGSQSQSENSICLQPNSRELEKNANCKHVADDGVTEHIFRCFPTKWLICQTDSIIQVKKITSAKNHNRKMTDLSSLCRCCLTNGTGKMKNMLNETFQISSIEEDTEIFVGINLVEALRLIGVSTDLIPACQQICSGCEDNLKFCVDFHLLCQKSTQTLRNIKEEGKWNGDGDTAKLLQNQLLLIVPLPFQ
jgi:hypothetical protein